MINLVKQTEAVIFDFDGTLVDSMWIWPDIDDVYLKTYNLKAPETFHEDMEGMSFSEVAQYFLDIFPTLPHTKEQLMDEWKEMSYERYVTQVKLKPGAEEFIRTARCNGVKVGIATSNDRMLVEDTLHALGITELFDVIRTSCEAKKGKPAPDVYLLVADELQVTPEKCLVFEDVPMGILAGKNAGMTVCAVEDEFSLPQTDKKKELADYYIIDYNDIKNETYEVL